MTASRTKGVLIPVLSAGSIALVAGAAMGFTWLPGGAPSKNAQTPMAGQGFPVPVTEVRLVDAEAVSNLLGRAARKHLVTAGAVKRFAAVDGIEGVDQLAISQANGAYSVLAGPTANSEFKVFVGAETDVAEDQSSCASRAEDNVQTCREFGDERVHGVDLVVVTRKAPDPYPDGMYEPVGDKPLTAADYPHLRVEHNIRVYRPDGTVTSVRETVYGPKSLDWDTVFSESDETMQALATDEQITWSALGEARR